MTVGFFSYFTEFRAPSLRFMRRFSTLSSDSDLGEITGLHRQLSRQLSVNEGKLRSALVRPSEDRIVEEQEGERRQTDSKRQTQTHR